MSELPKLSYTLTQAAEAINVSRPTMYQIAKRADFPAFQTANRWFIPIEPFKEWLKNQAMSFHQDQEA